MDQRSNTRVPEIVQRLGEREGISFGISSHIRIVDDDNKPRNHRARRSKEDSNTLHLPKDVERNGFIKV